MSSDAVGSTERSIKLIVFTPFVFFAMALASVVITMHLERANFVCDITDVEVTIYDAAVPVQRVLVDVDVSSNDACFKHQLVILDLPCTSTNITAVRRQIRSNYYIGRRMSCWLDEQNQVTWRSDMPDRPGADAAISAIFTILLIAYAFGLVKFAAFYQRQ